MAKTEPGSSSRAKNSDLKKFSQCLSSPIIKVTVGKSRTFYLHRDLLVQESKRLSGSLNNDFKEANEKAVELPEEDPELFGFFVEYLYRDCAILSQPIKHASQCVTLAKLYVFGDRFIAPKFQTACLWRYIENFKAGGSGNLLSAENICDLLEIAAESLPEQTPQDPLQQHIFWYGTTGISVLQKFDAFHQLLRDKPDLGRYLCMWVGRGEPQVAPKKPIGGKFLEESEYPLKPDSAQTATERTDPEKIKS